MSDDATSNERFKIMERKLFCGIMTPGAVLTIVFGVWLWLGYGFGAAAGCTPSSRWSPCSSPITFTAASCCADFKRDRNRHGHVLYRWFNEVPVIILFAAVILVVVKPF